MARIPTGYDDAQYDLPDLGGRLEPEPTEARLEDCTLEQLLELRAKIDALIPPQSLQTLDMEHELVVQLKLVKALQQKTNADLSTPANQLAQVAGQVANVLVQLSKLQVDVYTSERLKKAEAVLIECLNVLPDATKEEFLMQYERALGL